MVSDFRKKKMLHVFQTFFDTDRNGSIEKSDFDLAADKITKLKGWAGDAKHKEVHETLLKIWDGLQKADANNDGTVSVDEWVAMCEEYAQKPANPQEWQTLYMKFMFSLFDANNDGSIDKDEFTSVYVTFGLDKEESATAFQKMTKGKANVTWAEFQNLWKEYFGSEDVNAAGNFIFGKASF